MTTKRGSVEAKHTKNEGRFEMFAQYCTVYHPYQSQIKVNNLNQN